MSLAAGRGALVVLDFDGTLTDCDAHAPAFRAASARALALELGWDDATLAREWPRALAAVAAQPADVAWVVAGLGVCPATCDPYVATNGATLLLLSRHAPGLGEDGITAATLAVHRAAYESTPPPFRPGARELLATLAERGHHAALVTNSHGRTVARLLAGLASPGTAPPLVRGGAGKFEVCASASDDERFGALPATTQWPELARPVQLRRGRYFDVLRALWDETCTTPATTLVVGDNFELDLAMPAALGCDVHLVTRPSTLPHEERIARGLPRGGADARLAAIMERLRA